MNLGFSPISDTLPVFTRETGDSQLYYAPGFVLRVWHEARTAVEAEIIGENPRSPLVEELVRRADGAKARWNALPSQPYEPVCLTLYLDNRCNLACEYCYSDPAGPATAATIPLHLEAILKAAKLVAQACSRRGLPLTIVLHGGGEPTLDPGLLGNALRLIDQTADHFQISTFKYLATNGVMPVGTAQWVAAHFDLVGISCDGPADIQHQQRPLPNGANTTPFVERTADILRGLDTAFHVRVTVTPGTIDRQEEIAAYICERLAPLEIHVEPVYSGGRQQGGFTTGENDAPAETNRLAEAFTTHFLRSQAFARSAGIPLLFSGSRPWEIHGPFCQVFRDVLQLVPGDAASPCFKLSDARQVSRLDAQIGLLAAEGYLLDREKIAVLRTKLLRQPAPCRDCFNQYHCARVCPDACPLEKEDRELPHFRCKVQMRLSGAVIDRAASALIVNRAAPLAAAPIQVGT